MRYLLTLILSSFICLYVSAQITASQQKALNAAVDYANRSADEVNSVVQSLMNYYPNLHRQISWGVSAYTCPVQLEDYYLNQAMTLSKNLSVTHAATLSAKIKELRAAAEKIDGQCKTLDTYFKLQDYKQDNFAKAHVLFGDLMRQQLTASAPFWMHGPTT